MTTFYDQVRDVAEIDWDVAKHLKIAYLPNQNSGDDVTELVSGTVATMNKSLTWNADGSISSSSGLTTTGLQYLPQLANDRINPSTDSWIMVLDIKPQQASSNNGDIVVLKDGTWGKGYFYVGLNNGSGFTIAIKDNSFVNQSYIESPAPNTRHIYVVHHLASTGYLEVYKDGVLVGNIAPSGNATRNCNNIMYGVNAVSDSYSLMMYHKGTTDFTQDELNAVLTDPYQVFQTQEDVIDEYCLMSDTRDTQYLSTPPLDSKDPDFTGENITLKCKVMLTTLSGNDKSFISLRNSTENTREYIELSVGSSGVFEIHWVASSWSHVRYQSPDAVIAGQWYEVEALLDFSNGLETDFKMWVDGVEQTLTKAGTANLTGVLIGHDEISIMESEGSMAYAEIIDHTNGDFHHFDFDKTVWESGTTLTSETSSLVATGVNMTNANFDLILDKTTVNVTADGTLDYPSTDAAIAGEKNAGDDKLKEIVIHGIDTVPLYEAYDSTTSRFVIRGLNEWTDKSNKPLDGIVVSGIQAVRLASTVVDYGYPIFIKNLLIESPTHDAFTSNTWGSSFNFVMSDCDIYSPAGAGVYLGYQNGSRRTKYTLERVRIDSYKAAITSSRGVDDVNILDCCLPSCARKQNTYTDGISLTKADNGQVNISNLVMNYEGDTTLYHCSAININSVSGLSLNNVYCNVVDSNNDFFEGAATRSDSNVNTGVDMAGWFDANNQLTDTAQTVLTGTGWNNSNIAEWAWATEPPVDLNHTFELSTAFDLYSSLDSTIATSFGLYQGHTASQSTGYDLYRSHELAVTASYDLYGSHTQVQSTGFDLEDTTPSLISSIATSFDLYTSKIYSLATAYSLYASKGVAQDVQYDLYASKIAQFSTGFDLYSDHTVSQATAYALYEQHTAVISTSFDLGTAGLTVEVTTSYDLYAAKTTVQEALYSLYEKHEATLDTSFDLYGSHTTSQAVSFDLYSSHIKDIMALFSLYNQNSVEIDTSFDLYNSRTGVVITNYDVYSAKTRAITTYYDLGATVPRVVAKREVKIANERNAFTVANSFATIAVS